MCLHRSIVAGIGIGSREAIRDEKVTYLIREWHGMAHSTDFHQRCIASTRTHLHTEHLHRLHENLIWPFETEYAEWKIKCLPQNGFCVGVVNVRTLRCIVRNAAGYRLPGSHSFANDDFVWTKCASNKWNCISVCPRRVRPFTMCPKLNRIRQFELTIGTEGCIIYCIIEESTGFVGKLFVRCAVMSEAYFTQTHAHTHTTSEWHKQCTVIL